MIDFSTLKGLTIPEGIVKQIASGGVVLWKREKYHITGDLIKMLVWASYSQPVYEEHGGHSWYPEPDDDLWYCSNCDATSPNGEDEDGCPGNVTYVWDWPSPTLTLCNPEDMANTVNIKWDDETDTPDISRYHGWLFQVGSAWYMVAEGSYLLCDHSYNEGDGASGSEDFYFRISAAYPVEIDEDGSGGGDNGDDYVICDICGTTFPTKDGYAEYQACPKCGDGELVVPGNGWVSFIVDGIKYTVPSGTTWAELLASNDCPMGDMDGSGEMKPWYFTIAFDRSTVVVVGGEAGPAFGFVVPGKDAVVEAGAHTSVEVDSIGRCGNCSALLDENGNCTDMQGPGCDGFVGEEDDGTTCPRCGSSNWDGEYCIDCSYAFFGTCDICGSDLDATYACTNIECENHPDNNGGGSSGGEDGTCPSCGAPLDEYGNCIEPGPECPGY